MTQPTIINAGDDNTTKDTTAYNPTADSGDSRTFNSVTIPASANTVCFFFIADLPPTSNIVTGLSATGSGVELFDFDPTPLDSNHRSSRVMVMDVSGLGAFSSTVTASLSSATTVGSILGVICTDGFIESFSTTADRSLDLPRHLVYSPNYENNTLCVQTVTDGDTSSSFTVSSGTELYNVADSKGSGTSVYAFSQATNGSDGSKEIKYTSSTAGHEAVDITYLFSTQRNPFATNFGPVIRPIISHDVIS